MGAFRLTQLLPWLMDSCRRIPVGMSTESKVPPTSRRAVLTLSSTNGKYRVEGSRDEPGWVRMVVQVPAAPPAVLRCKSADHDCGDPPGTRIRLGLWKW